jgi:hypothetical protein
MIFYVKKTFILTNSKIPRPKVIKILGILLKMFYKYRPKNLDLTLEKAFKIISIFETALTALNRFCYIAYLLSIL